MPPRGVRGPRGVPQKTARALPVRTAFELARNLNERSLARRPPDRRGDPIPTPSRWGEGPSTTPPIPRGRGMGGAGGHPPPFPSRSEGPPGGGAARWHRIPPPTHTPIGRKGGRQRSAEGEGTPSFVLRGGGALRKAEFDKESGASAAPRRGCGPGGPAPLTSAQFLARELPVRLAWPGASHPSPPPHSPYPWLSFALFDPSGVFSHFFLRAKEALHSGKCKCNIVFPINYLIGFFMTEVCCSLRYPKVPDLSMEGRVFFPLG